MTILVMSCTRTGNLEPEDNSNVPIATPASQSNEKGSEANAKVGFSSSPMSNVDLYYKDPEALYEKFMMRQGTLLGNLSAFDFYLVRLQSHPRKIWSVLDKIDKYNQVSFPMTDNLHYQFFEMLASNGVIVIDEKENEKVKAISFSDTYFFEQHVRILKDKNTGIMSVPVLILGSYIPGSLDIVGEYDPRPLCKDRSVFSRYISANGDWGKKYLNGRTVAKFQGCPIAWDGDLTQFRMRHIKLIAFEKSD